MPTSGRWRGSAALTPGKVKWTVTSSKVTVTTDYTGPYATCFSDKPTVGQSYTVEGFLMTLTGYEITELDAGAGRLDLTLEIQVDDSNQSSEPIGEPTFEVEYVELQRPLETHGRCGLLNPGRPKNPKIDKIATWEDWQVLDENDYDSSFPRGTNVGDIWTLAQYKSLKEQGVDSYVVFQPIVRRNSIHLGRPTDLGAAAGKLQDPPSGANFPGLSYYEWLGGPDRVTKSKRTYNRCTEWLGAQHWETLMYQYA